MQKLNVTTTHLEMKAFSDFTPKTDYLSQLHILPIDNHFFLNFSLFVGVGLPWDWYSRLTWGIEDWELFYQTHNAHTFLAFHENTCVGYFELVYHTAEEVEINFLGLLPQYLSSGWGGHLLSHAVAEAWKGKTQKVRLHTCNLDHEFALQNYLSRGFSIIAQTQAIEEILDKEEYIMLISKFFSAYIDKYPFSRKTQISH